MLQALKKAYNGVNVAFIRDISVKHIGGAEITDAYIIKIGRELGYNIHVFDKTTPVDRLYDIADFDVAVVSNCWQFDEEYMEIFLRLLKSMPFVKLEHDHRSLDAHRAKYAKPLFERSALNVFVSPQHLEDHRKEGGWDGVAVFPPIDTILMRPVPGVKRRPHTALIGVPRKANRKENVTDHPVFAYMKHNPSLSFEDLGEIVPFEKMPEAYSRYEYFVHLPKVRWSCERVIFEAALCGCKVVTNSNAEGTSWGQDLDNPQKLKAWIDARRYEFWDHIHKLVEGKCVTSSPAPQPLRVVT
jgi:hypothetical protein